MKAFLLPPLNLIVLALVLVALRRRLGWPRRLPWIVTAIAAYLVCTPIVGENLLRLHQSYPPLTLRDPSDAPGAIVVLSAGYRDRAPDAGGTRLDGLSLTRVLYGDAVQTATGLPILVTGGQIRERAPPIAAVMAGFLRTRMNAEVAWVEARARTTWENARESAAMLRADGVDHAYLVTHAWHMPRAVHAFRHHGIRVTPAPTGFVGGTDVDPGSVLPSHAGLRDSYYAFHEVFARLAYRFYAAVDGDRG